MFCIEIEFLAGRYHATPWGRHVNEGVPEWPPAPYRIARALVDTWYRKCPDWTLSRVESVLTLLAGAPDYYLPETGASHLRLYMDVNDANPANKSELKIQSSKKLIFDPFVTMKAGDTAYLVWRDVDPDPAVLRDLGELLEQVTYLGRSESQVAMRLAANPPAGTPDMTVGFSSDTSTQQEFGSTEVACVLSPRSYQTNPVVQSSGGGRKKNPEPWTWMQALCFSTADLLKGWSNPPILVSTRYLVFSQGRRRQVASYRQPDPRFTVVRYTLDSSVLPPVTSTLSIAEQIRRKLMGIHRRIRGGDPALVAQVFSGKNLDGTPLEGHRHAYILPVDQDMDGFVDHVYIRARAPFALDELQALDGMRSLWQSDNRPDIDCVLSGTGEPSSLMPVGTVWISGTPFVPTRFFKSRDGEFVEWLRSQVMAECVNHGFPIPVGIDLISEDQAGVRFKWYEFMRSRKGQKPRYGYGLRLTFAQPVRGPICLGFCSHFGLGQFRCEI